MEKSAAIVLSAGRGKRMKSDIPKQYLMIGSYPVIYYSLKAFQDSEVSEIVLVTGAEDVEYCRKEIVEKYHLTKVKAVVPGGAERYDSVFEGMKAVGSADYVLVHDGARPLVSVDMIRRSLECARKEQACVVAVQAKDTIRIADENQYAVSTPDRKTLWQIQTPQAFSYSLLYDSYQKLYDDIENKKDVPAITDDAMVVEYSSGIQVKLLEGDYTNIKITTPEDKQIAEIFLQAQKCEN